MVSNGMNMTVAELVQAFQRFKTEYADDPDWQQRRAELPADWPF